MYSNTLKWKSAVYIEKEERQARNIIRNKICKDSIAWTEDLNMTAHRQAMKKLYDDLEAKKYLQSVPGEHDHTRTKTLRAAMSAKEMTPPSQWTNNRSTVLCWQTVFMPPSDARTDKYAEWPTYKEMFNEGDDRIQKDQKIHMRMLAPPRLTGNDTLAILLRKFSDHLPLDDFKTKIDPESIFMRAHTIGEQEIDDGEGETMLGSELMGLLDPVDCL